MYNLQQPADVFTLRKAEACRCGFFPLRSRGGSCRVCQCVLITHYIFISSTSFLIVIFRSTSSPSLTPPLHFSTPPTPGGLKSEILNFKKNFHKISIIPYNYTEVYYNWPYYKLNTSRLCKLPHYKLQSSNLNFIANTLKENIQNIIKKE